MNSLFRLLRVFPFLQNSKPLQSLGNRFSLYHPRLATKAAPPPSSQESAGVGAGDGIFDPLYNLLHCREASGLTVGTLNLRELTPFQRCLLTLDGTVTKYLETYTLEPIQVLLLHRATLVLNETNPWLDTPPATEVITREVLLRGAYSTTVYAHAVSLLVTDRLPESLLEALENEPGGIGRALLNGRIENRREILWYGREHLCNLPEDIRACTGEDFLSRAYCIIVQDKPVVLINERFPAHLHMNVDPGADRPRPAPP
jgi:chorismate-pyruvate lyase